MHGRETWMRNCRWKTRRREAAWKTRCRWENNIRIGLEEIGWQGEELIYLAQYRVQLRAVANTVMILWVPYNTEYFLSSWGLIGSQEGLCSIFLVSYLVTQSSVSYRPIFLRVSGLRPFKLWGTRVWPAISVTLRTPNARQVADIVGLSHGSKGKRS